MQTSLSAATDSMNFIGLLTGKLDVIFACRPGDEVQRSVCMTRGLGIDNAHDHSQPE